MLPLDFHPLVESDLADSAEWYARRQPGLEKRFLAEVRRRFDGLPAGANLYAVRFADIRRVNLPVFQHGVFYFIAEEAVVVLAFYMATVIRKSNCSDAGKNIPNEQYPLQICSSSAITSKCWTKINNLPALPKDVGKITEKYLEAFEKLTGKTL